jgi:microcystin-dependent protein
MSILRRDTYANEDISLWAKNTSNSTPLVPVGTIMMYGGPGNPDTSLWRICDGTSLVRTLYPELFAVIGTTFGSDGPDVFFLPDLRDRFPIGANTHALGSVGGTASVSISANNLPQHTHPVTITDPGHSHLQYTAGNAGNIISSAGSIQLAGTNFNINTQATSTASTGITASAGNNTTTHVNLNVLNPYTSVNFIIKCFS